MSKRWKVRKRNAAKLERSRKILAGFPAKVAAAVEKVMQDRAPLFRALAKNDPSELKS